MVDFTPGVKNRQWPAISAAVLRSLKLQLTSNLLSYIQSRTAKGYTSNELTEALVLLEQHCKSDSDANTFLDAVCDIIIPKAKENDGWFHGTSGHLSMINAIKAALGLNDSKDELSAATLVRAMMANDEADQKQRLELLEQKQKLSEELKEVKSSKEDLAKQNAVQLLEIQVDLKRLAEIEQKLKAQEEVSAKLKSDNETLRSKDERRGQKKRKGDDVLRERERIALVRERDAEKIVTEYNSRLAVLEKREEAVGKLALSLSQSQAQVLSISQRLSQSQPPSPSQSPRPATVLHVKPKTEMERIRENLSPLRLEVMLRLINSIRGNNTAAYVCLQELLLDIANKTDRGTAEIVSSWHDQGVVTALATVPSNLSDTNGYTMPSPSASYPRDKTLHSFVILLENGTLLGRKDLTLCAQIAKYSKEYRAEYKTAENVSASASISASSSAFSFASPLPVSRTPSIRGGFGDHKR